MPRAPVRSSGSTNRRCCPPAAEAALSAAACRCCGSSLLARRPVDGADAPGAVGAREDRQLRAHEAHGPPVEGPVILRRGNRPRCIAFELHLPRPALAGHLLLETDGGREVVGFVLGAS